MEPDREVSAGKFSTQIPLKELPPPLFVDTLDAPATVSTEGPVATTFTKIEKSLASLGFFSPSSRRLKNQKVKRISFTREVDGKRVEVTAEIIPSAMFGLPITADQDKYLALQEVITRTLQSEGKVTNPIRFKSADLIRLMNRSTKTGKNFKEINDWLDVMMSTTIFSQGTVYKAGEKRFAKDRFHVFDRAVSVGKELPDGSTADANYVWLSEWQLENINQNFLLPIDLETYRELKNHISKALVPLLQIWLFASRKAGSFEKRYDELCDILTLKKHPTPSEILRQLKPSLDELTRYQYLEKWRIEKTSDRKSYKIIFFHGSKFHRDHRKRLEQKNQIEQPMIIAQSEPMEPALPEPGKLDVLAPTGPDMSGGAKRSSPRRKATSATIAAPIVESAPAVEKGTEPADDRVQLIDELAARALAPSVAMKLLRSIPEEHLERVRDYIDYWDSQKSVGPGLLHDLIKNFDPLPPTFTTRRQRETHERDAKRNADRWMVKQALEQQYEAYQQETIDRFIAEELTAEEFEYRVQAFKKTTSQQEQLWLGKPSPTLAEHLARNAIRAEISKQVRILSFEDFRKRELPRILSERQLDPAELGIEPSCRGPQE